MVLTLQNVDGISARINDSKMNKLLIALALAPAAALVAPSVPRAYRRRSAYDGSVALMRGLSRAAAVLPLPRYAHTPLRPAPR